MGIETGQYDSVLVPVLMSKLPNGVRLRIAWENRDETWEINHLMDTILKEVEAREASEGAKILTPRPAVPPRTSHNGNGSTLKNQTGEAFHRATRISRLPQLSCNGHVYRSMLR